MEREKSRHGCLTTYLVFGIVGYGAMGAFYLFGGGSLLDPTVPDWEPPLRVFMSLVEIVLLFALLDLRRWAFWGSCVTSAARCLVSVSLGVNPVVALLLEGAFGVALLYGVLQIGDRNKGWSQLD